MSLLRQLPNLPVSTYAKAGFKTKKVALHNMKKPEFRKILLEMSPEFDNMMNRLGESLAKVLIQNPSIVEEPPKEVKKLDEEEEDDDQEEEIEEEDCDEPEPQPVKKQVKNLIKQINAAKKKQSKK